MATPIPKNRASFTLEEAVRATGGTVVRTGERFVRAVSVVSDSRAATPGSAFVALRGDAHDGHTFAPAVAAKGGMLLVLAKGQGAAIPETSDATVIEVDDTLVAWGALARFHLERWRAHAVDPSVIGITGSAGKTTTKELLAALLGVIAPTHFTAGNLNNRVGVPSVVFALEPIHRFCVLEMGMSLPGEIAAITAIARPDVAIITNVGLAHAEGVGGGREGVMREKGAIYAALDERGVAIVNADDDYVERAAANAKVANVVRFGRGENANVRLVHREPSADGSLVELARQGETLRVRLPLPGDAPAIDLAAALAAQASASGTTLDAAAIDRALASVRLDGRATVKRLAGDIVLLDDTYNANPASMRSALATLNELAGARRRVVVLGEMKELGEHADAEHASLGDAIADARPDVVVGCGGKIDLALDRAASRGVPVVKAASTDAAALETRQIVRPGDAVLVKGSRGVQAERVVKALESLPLPPDSASSPSDP